MSGRLHRHVRKPCEWLLLLPSSTDVSLHCDVLHHDKTKHTRGRFQTQLNTRLAFLMNHTIEYTIARNKTKDNLNAVEKKKQ
jgi:hypothetical protein